MYIGKYIMQTNTESSYKMVINTYVYIHTCVHKYKPLITLRVNTLTKKFKLTSTFMHRQFYIMKLKWP